MSVTLKEKLYQMFILGTDGGYYKELLKDGLGGIIFFSKDIQTKTQFKSLIDDIKLISKIPPFLSIDQEGIASAYNSVRQDFAPSSLSFLVI